jgi:chromosome partitioning protein
MRKIALVNQKGGVGKTTTAVNLSSAIARLDRRVLLIDLDPQSNATISLGVIPHEQKDTSYSLLNGGPFNPIKLSDHLDLVPSNIELAGAEMELTSVIGRETILRDALAEVKSYDFLILDCSPSLGLLSVNSLTTANEVMVPLQCEFLALHGVSLLLKTIELVKKRLNPALAITGVIPCMYDVRKGLARDVVVEIERHFGDKVTKTKIRSNVRLAEAPSHGKSIFDYAPDSYGAEDYLALGREVVGIEMIEKPSLAPEREGASSGAPTGGVPASRPSPYVPASAYTPSPVLPESQVVIQPRPEPQVVIQPRPESQVEIMPRPEPQVEIKSQPEPQVVIKPPPPPLNSADKVFLDELVEGAFAPEGLPVAPTEVPVTLAAPPAPPQPSRRALEEGLVEFIELIPLEIEDLPSSGAGAGGNRH